MVSKFLHNSRPIYRQIKKVSLGSLYRNAYALIMSNLMTALSGYMFWVIAARRFSDESIGFASAIFSAMLLVALISDLGFSEGLIRFLPKYRDPRVGDAMINRTFLIRLLVGILIAALFLVGLPWWSPGLMLLNQQSTLVLAFIFLVLLNGLFTLSNSVFVASRTAIYVLLSVLIFNMLKILFVIVLPTSSEILVLLFSVAVAFLITVLVELFIFIPKVRLGYLPRINPHFSGSSTFIKYSAPNQIANILLQLPIFLLPLLVINYLGPEANSRFYMAYMTAGLLRTAGLSISQSAFAESSKDSNNLLKHIRSSFWLSFLLFVFGGLAFYFLAPLILSTFGRQYSHKGTYLLRWLIVSVAPFMLINLFLIIYRVRKNLKILVISCLVWALISVASSLVGIRINGLHGLVIGWTAGQFFALIMISLLYVWYWKFIIRGLDLGKPASEKL